jgi:hypothetical protein
MFASLAEVPLPEVPGGLLWTASRKKAYCDWAYAVANSEWAWVSPPERSHGLDA